MNPDRPAMDRATIARLIREELTRTLNRDQLVGRIRAVCATEFNARWDDPFFDRDYEPGESADAALFRLFCAEAAAQLAEGVSFTIDDVILTLCHG